VKNRLSLWNQNPQQSLTLTEGSWQDFLPWSSWQSKHHWLLPSQLQSTEIVHLSPFKKYIEANVIIYPTAISSVELHE